MRVDNDVKLRAIEEAEELPTYNMTAIHSQPTSVVYDPELPTAAPSRNPFRRPYNPAPVDSIVDEARDAKWYKNRAPRDFILEQTDRTLPVR